MVWNQSAGPDLAEQKIHVSEVQGVLTGSADIICNDVHLADVARGDLSQKGKPIDADLWLARGLQSAVQVLRDLPFDPVLRPAIHTVEPSR